jgi:predicted DCC family thiol-disulfide oxidoreductase YuxK
MPPDTTANEGRLLVLYDGLCALCDGAVQFLLRHDANDVFRFAPQQSDFAQQILSRHGLQAAGADTICLIENYGFAAERVLTKSDAALRIAQGLGSIWNTFQITRILPHTLRDAAYDCIARNRYRIFGRRTACRVISHEEQYKFLG